MNKSAAHVMKNPYDTVPLQIIIVNPFTSGIIRTLYLPTQRKTVGGGESHRTKTIQLGGP